MKKILNKLLVTITLGLMTINVCAEDLQGLIEAANQPNNKWAAYNLGQMYYFGTGGVTKNPEEALHYLLKAADLGNIDAMNTVGIIYHNNKNYIKALKYYEMAASQGNPYALYNLGLVYEYGLGVIQDKETAKKHFQQLINIGDKALIARLEALSSSNNKTKNQTIVENHQQAIAKGDPKAMLSLGRIYKNGLGIPKNVYKAFDYFTNAAKNDDVDAMINLAILYKRGQGTPKSNNLAIYWFDKAEKIGDESQKATIS